MRKCKPARIISALGLASIAWLPPGAGESQAALYRTMHEVWGERAGARIPDFMRDLTPMVRARGYIDAPRPGDSLNETGQIRRGAGLGDWAIDIPGDNPRTQEEREVYGMRLEQSEFPYSGYVGERLSFIDPQAKWRRQGQWRLIDVGRFQKREDTPMIDRLYASMREKHPRNPFLLYPKPSIWRELRQMDNIRHDTLDLVMKTYEKDKKHFPKELIDKFRRDLYQKESDNSHVFVLLNRAPDDLNTLKSYARLKRKIAATISLIRWDDYNFSVPTALASDPKLIERYAFLPHFAWNVRGQSLGLLSKLAETNKIGEITQNVVFDKHLPDEIKNVMILKVLETAESGPIPLNLLVFSWNDYMIRLFRRAFPEVRFEELLPALSIGDTDKSEHLRSLVVSSDPDSDFQVFKRSLRDGMPGVRRDSVDGQSQKHFLEIEEY